MTGPTSQYLFSPLRRAMTICEPVLKPKAMVKIQMYRSPPIAEPPIATSLTRPKKAVSVTLMMFCASKLSRIG